MTLEDYVQKLDWGEIRFPFGTKQYRIFYGGDLENAYDFLTLFEIIYSPVDGRMTELAGRSPLDELWARFDAPGCDYQRHFVAAVSE